MPQSRDHDRFERLVRRMDPDATLRRVWSLEGGTSAEVTALEVENADGASKRLVVRRHGPRDLQANPGVAADEFRLLEVLHGHGLAIPAPRHVDESGAVLASPFVVVDYIDGVHEFAPADLPDVIRQMAEFLAALHRVDSDDPALAFLSRQDIDIAGIQATRPGRLGQALLENRVHAVLETHWPPPRHDRTVVLHGDFWPGNILWREGQLAAVIDWENAASGDPLADLANVRLELVWSSGIDAMEDFTRAYLDRSGTDVAALPLWDLWAAIRPASTFDGWGLDTATERDMIEKHRAFITHAIEAI
jgi:aminoglycoside phosphotransferase (APT) family kinase protein